MPSSSDNKLGFVIVAVIIVVGVMLLMMTCQRYLIESRTGWESITEPKPKETKFEKIQNMNSLRTKIEIWRMRTSEETCVIAVPITNGASPMISMECR